jgi:hypothetical protein
VGQVFEFRGAASRSLLDATKTAEPSQLRVNVRCLRLGG